VVEVEVLRKVVVVATVAVAIGGFGGWWWSRSRSSSPTVPSLPSPVLQVGSCGDLINRRVSWSTHESITHDLEAAFSTGDAVAMFVDPPLELRRRVDVLNADERAHVFFCSQCPGISYPLGEGWIGPIGVSIEKANGRVQDSDLASNGLRCAGRFDYVWGGWVARTPKGWRIYNSPPREALSSIKVERTRVEAWISLARRWIRVDTDLDVDANGQALVLRMPPIENPDGMWTGPVRTGFRIIALTIDGVPVEHTRRHVAYEPNREELVVSDVTGHVRVHVGFEGVPSYHENTTQLRRNELELSSWVPGAPLPELHPMELVVHVPVGEGMISSMDLVESARDEGWVTYGAHGERDREPLVVVRDTLGTETETKIVDRGTRGRLAITLASDCRSVDRFGKVLDAVIAIAPLPPMRAVDFDAFRELTGQHGDDLILLKDIIARSLCEPVGDPNSAHIVLAHELAHAWFGGRVRIIDDEAARWWESLAEYTATSLWQQAGIAQRRERSTQYASLVVDAVATVAGAPHADWLRVWLHRPGAPDLRLQNVRTDHGNVHADLVQTSVPPFVGAVELAFVSGDKRIATHRTEFTTTTTAIDLPLPPGAEKLVLDPDYRLPRKYDVKRSDEDNQRVWPMSAR
jgi:hypothetical protein